ncbi:conserved hypothetical protein [Desulfamplus magnetovallimortis]|uniref:Uncharacterized protein n=1 Tax=Desulfamplus magnetovallimortis TaxID=1246637 RepID=A0A1W1HE78_9BACT|nr:AAA-like domain-containing protein [Desulfamplus magnetovallimortis]SLM30804.1 conserved hypothetical protein [Desulfamplus magnetovallimortis]
MGSSTKFDEKWEAVLKKSGAFAAFSEMLSLWSAHSEKPVVLLIDEIDALVGDTLISVLRQLREGYNDRPDHFPSSVLLCGVRDIRDYRIHSEREKSIITGGSAFNVKAKSLRLGDFNFEEVLGLTFQHETETGQKFTKEAVNALWDNTCGQPWLVNALCYEVTFEMREFRERTKEIPFDAILQARENLIQRRETHLDQLADKLKEERVRRVIEPILSGETSESSFNMPDIEYLVDLGLIRRDVNGNLDISNPIYREVIPRELIAAWQSGMYQKPSWYITETGRLDMHKLMQKFQEFFRENSEHWVERFQYKEAGPHLLLQAFLQRIINGGGRIDREYGLGKKRVDIMVQWSEAQKEVIELKILRKSLEKTIDEGKRQLASYMERCGVNSGHLVIFDRSVDKEWDEKIFYREVMESTRKFFIWGM